MKIADLLKNTCDDYSDFLKVRKYLEFFVVDFEKALPTYMGIVVDLLKMTPSENVRHIEIDIHSYDEGHIDILGVTPDGAKNSLVFEKWEDWLGFDIPESVYEVRVPAMIMGLALAEMTCMGFTQDEIQKNKEKFVKALKFAENKVSKGEVSSVEEFFLNVAASTV